MEEITAKSPLAVSTNKIKLFKFLLAKNALPNLNQLEKFFSIQFFPNLNSNAIEFSPSEEKGQMFNLSKFNNTNRTWKW